MNPEGEFPSMFEPVHGSAPDIAGLGYANPIATFLAGAMMLSHLGEKDGATLIETAVADVLRDGLKSRDLGGSAGTSEISEAIIQNIRAQQ